MHALCCRHQQEDVLGMVLLRDCSFPVTNSHGSRDGPSLMHMLHIQKTQPLLLGKGRDGEDQIQTAERKGKHRGREGKDVLGNCKRIILWVPSVTAPPVWPTAPDTSSSWSQCHMPPNAFLLPLHCHLSLFLLQVRKPQLPSF